MADLPATTRTSAVGRLGALVGVLGRLATQRSDPRALAGELERLGGTFVKLGQVLSSRSDLLDEAHRQALGRLRRGVEPVDPARIREVLAEEWGCPVADVLGQLHEEPLGAASLGQVHSARLVDGTPVAIKVQRPEIAEQVETDLRLLMRAAGAGRLVDARFDVRDVVLSFADALRLELDYRIEAANLAWFADRLDRWPHLAVPRPRRELGTSRVLVMDLVEGQPLSSAEVPAELGPILAAELSEAYVELMLTEGRFHSDPHLGNLLLDGRVLHILDFGQVELLDADLRRSVTHLLLGVAELEANVVADVLIGLSSASPTADPRGYRNAVAQVITRSNLQMGAHLEMGRAVLDLIARGSSHGYRPPSALAGLAKMLMMLDEVTEQLDPTLDPSELLRKQAASVLLAQLGEGAAPRSLLGDTLRAQELMSRLPRHLESVLERLADGTFEVNVGGLIENRVLKAAEKVANRVAVAVVVASMVLAAALLAETGAPWVLGLSGASVVLLLLAVVIMGAMLAMALLTDGFTGS